MSNIVEFPGREPEKDSLRMFGTALCMDCRHEWEAEQIIEKGELPGYMECPQCGLIRGLFKFPHSPDVEYRVCQCGNELFIITRKGHLCPNCGIYQAYGEDE